MNHLNEPELERWADRELKRLPNPEAPRTLFHRVMLAVHERARLPWYRKSWPEWPKTLQCGSLAVLGALALLVFWWVGTLEPATVNLGLAERSQEALRKWLPAWTAWEALAGAFKLVFRLTVHQFIMIVASVTVFAYFVCIGLTAACFRLARVRS